MFFKEKINFPFFNEHKEHKYIKNNVTPHVLGYFTFREIRPSAGPLGGVPPYIIIKKIYPKKESTPHFSKWSET